MWGRTATELAAGIRSREFSAREVLEAHLERIDAVNPRVNAIVTLDREGALAAADAADASPPRGVLHGLPIAVKDLEDTAGMRTTYGSPLFRDNVPAQDCAMVANMRAQGAVIVAKTNVPEFGAGANSRNPVWGATGNPFNPLLNPGGGKGDGKVMVRA